MTLSDLDLYRVFGLTLDEEDDDREGDHTSADEDDSLLSDNIDNPTNLFSSATGQHSAFICCLSNALHSSIGQNIKSSACPVSDVRCPAIVPKTSDDHNSAKRHPIPFMFGSRLGF